MLIDPKMTSIHSLRSTVCVIVNHHTNIIIRYLTLYNYAQQSKWYSACNSHAYFHTIVIQYTVYYTLSGQCPRIELVKLLFILTDFVVSKTLTYLDLACQVAYNYNQLKPKMMDIIINIKLWHRKFMSYNSTNIHCQVH